MSSFKSLPSHVRKELLRHVNPATTIGVSPVGTPAAATASEATQQQRQQLTLAQDHTGLNDQAKLKQQQHQYRHMLLQKERRSGLRKSLTASLVLFGVAASFPLLSWWWIERLNDRDEPLTAPQIRRGAFMNSGSRDVGRDPDWDFERNQHKYKKGYGEIDDNEDEDDQQNLLDRMGMSPVNRSDLKALGRDALLAAARGLPPQVSFRNQAENNNQKEQQHSS